MDKTADATSKAAMELARQVAQAVRDGTLTLRQAVNLSDREMAAVQQMASRYRRQGMVERAIATYGLLLVHDLYNGRYWAAMGELQQRAGQAAIALACLQAAALLGTDSPALRQRQASCLRQLEQPGLAREALN